MSPLAGDMGRALPGEEVGLTKRCCHLWHAAPWELEGNPCLGEPSLCCLCGFVPLGKETTVCSISLAWISRKKAMAVGGIAGRGALPALEGDDKTPHSSPCCPLSVGMLLHCDISQSLLASCGSGLIVLLPQAVPLCPLLGQLFAAAAHPSNLELPCLKDFSSSAPGVAAPTMQQICFISWTLARCLQRDWGHGDISGDTGTSLLPSALSSPQGQKPPALHSQRSNRVSPQKTSS